MSIRLNKAIRELNIGLQTAVEFLEKRQELEGTKVDQNFKLSDEQYEALVEEFKRDKDVKNDAAKLFSKKPKEKKAPKPVEEVKVEVERPQFKIQGKIDLDSLTKKPTVQKEEPDSQPEPVVAAPEPETPEVEELVVATAEPEEVAGTEEPSVVSTDAEVEETDVEETDTEDDAEDSNIFKTKNEQKMLNTPQLKIQGKIDLSSINQSTRPKKKTKEERRKEREEKAAAQRV